MCRRLPLARGEDSARLISFLVTTQSDYPGRWWTMLPDGRIECQLCPRFCKLNGGQRGFCFVRQRVGDRIVLTTYGRSSGFCVDPIEKKPLNHFLPGTAVLSFGTAGCNLGCRFCQNWDFTGALHAPVASQYLGLTSHRDFCPQPNIST